MDSGYKKITDINFGEYDATNYRDSSSRDLFNRIFYRDNRVDQILENNKYFVLGDKGTGKTAYSVYLSNNIVDDTYASIVYMGETEYGKFVRLKEQRDLILSDEYYGAAEPPVRCGESHLSGLTEPPHFVY